MFFGLGTVEFLSLMIGDVVKYEKEGHSQISKFTFDMALKIQESLGMGDLIYNEMKIVLGFGKDSSFFSVASLQSKLVQSYLRQSVCPTLDEKVIRLLNR